MESTPAEESERGLVVWNKILSTALAIPGVKVRRDAYLRSQLGKHLPEKVVERAIRETPARAGVPRHVIERVAKSSIRWHRIIVVSTSTLAGIPGGFAIIGTVPADLAQFFAHILIVIQKLAYLNGWPELFDPEQDLDDETRSLLTLFVGVVFGANGAGQALQRLADAFAEQVVTRLPKKALTKYAIYNIAKKVARWLGISLTKKKFAEAIGRAIPFVAGGVAGLLTRSAFNKGAKRLQVHLASLPLAS